MKPRVRKNYLAENKSEMMGARPQVRSDDKAALTKHESYGEVPQYLQQRKLRWEEEEKMRQLNKPDEDCPDGMVCMPEAERLETLEVLEESEKQAKADLFAMPLTVQTIASTKKKNALEAKLKEIEDAKKIFSRPKVYIAMD